MAAPRPGPTGPGLSRGWRGRLDEQIKALEAPRDGLDSGIGCGCLSLARCRSSDPGDVVAERGPGAQILPPASLRPHDRAVIC